MDKQKNIERLAISLMGWDNTKLMDYESKQPNTFYVPEHDAFYHNFDPYDSIEDAWVILEKLGEAHPIISYWPHRKNPYLVIISIYFNNFKLHAKNAQEAICKAGLKWLDHRGKDANKQ